MSDATADAEDLSPPVAAPSEQEKKSGKQSAEQAEKDKKEAELLVADVPEVDIYIQLLIALFFFDKGLKEEVGSSSNSSSEAQCAPGCVAVAESQLCERGCVCVLLCSL